MTSYISDAQWRSAHRQWYTALKEARQQDQISGLRVSCSFCLALVRLISTPRLQRLEILFDVTSDHNKCRNHAAILPPHAIESQIRLVKPAGQRLVYVNPDSGRSDTISSDLGVPWEPLLLKTSQLSQDIEYNRPLRNSPRLIDREWIDISLLREWLSRCISSHTHTCGSRVLEMDQPFQKLLLIDTKRKCLAQVASSCRYVALSYVWGNTNTFLATNDNVQQLSQPKALEAENVRLPKTIEQAIALTLDLGEQYLWVDTLCIIQDAPDKADQLTAMATLFANATLTIVAAEGRHADAGFRGLRGISAPRLAGQKTAPILPDQHLIRPSSKHVWDDALLYPWSSRAWTFQEALCSRRLLYFANNTVRWCCRMTRWSEESDATDCASVYGGVERDRLRLLSPQLEVHKLPVLDEYEALINNFNTRKLTYNEDVLIAFAGVATKLAEKFQGGLVSGLPEKFFDICLLWRPLRAGHASRRRPTGSTAQVLLPSWSWAGWETEVTWPYTWNYTLDFAGPTPIMLGDIRPFYRIQPSYVAADGSVVPMNATWFDEAIEMMEKNSLPDWESSSIHNAVQQEWGLPSGEVVFKHSSEPSIKFCFPIQLSTSTTPARVTNLLSFRTMIGKFKLGETRRSMARIYTTNARSAGTLWHHDENDRDLLCATTGSIEDRSPIELIAILGCTVPMETNFMWETPDMSVLADFNKPNALARTEDIYNVMWIVRDESGIARRKGTGIILREIWEAEACDEMNITLG